MDLQELSDRAEITAALVRYTRAVDGDDWDRLDTVFTPDARIDYTQSGGIAAGYPEVKAWLAEVLPAFFPRRMHSLQQVDIAFDDAPEGQAPAGAVVAAYFHNPMPLTGPDGATRIVQFGGIYHHRMVRTPEGWRSCELVEEIVWKDGM